MSKYVRLAKGIYDKGRLVSPDQISDLIDDKHDWYVSTYNYNDKHLAHFKTHGSIKGIRDTTTKNIWLDFDHEDNPSLAQVDALELRSIALKLPSVTESNMRYIIVKSWLPLILTLIKNLTPSQSKLLQLKPR